MTLQAPTVLLTFSEGSGTVAQDNAGTNNRLTLQGANAANAWGTSGGVNAANGSYFLPTETAFGEWLTADRFPLGGQFTISFWAFANSLTGWRTLFDLGSYDNGGSGASGNYTTLWGTISNDSLQLYNANPQQVVSTPTASQPADGIWRFYSIVYGATDVVFYRVEADGTQVNLGSKPYNPAVFSLNPAAAEETYLLGNDAPTGTNWAAWAGGIDYFNVQAAALTSTQMRELRVAAEKNYDAASGAISIDVDGLGGVFGGAGNDILDGLAGDDALYGGAGADLMVGGTGNDQYLLDNAGDVIREFLGEGTDTAWVGATPTTVSIAANVEIIRLYGAGQFVAGSDGAEIFVSNGAILSNIAGGGGNDEFFVQGAANSIEGGAGDDIIRGSAGGGTFAGNAGNDQFVVGLVGTVLVEQAGEGDDTAWVAVNGFTVGDNIEVTRLAGSASQVSGGNTADQLVANPLLASTLDGRDGNDTLWGSPLADTLTGGAGDDIMRGQGGADVMVGGLGNDQYVVLDPGVQITELANEGYDTAWIGLAANTPFTLAENVERANLSGSANRVTGNAVGNALVGDAVASQLDGAAGDDFLFGSAQGDTLTGGAGSDIIFAGGGADLVVYAGAGWGQDQVAGFTQGLAKLDFRGSGISFGQLQLVASGPNTGVLFGNDNILVFNATLTQADFLFG